MQHEKEGPPTMQKLPFVGEYHVGFDREAIKMSSKTTVQVQLFVFPLLPSEFHDTGDTTKQKQQGNPTIRL